MNRMKYFHVRQHGFTPKKSTLTNPLSTYDYISSNLDNNCTVDVIFIDLSKAFDKGNHSLLILKLAELEFSSFFLLWLSNYIENRTQRVVIKGSVSQTLKVKSRVPQGCVISPLLVTLYLNEFLNKPHGSLFAAYAGDLKILGLSTNHAMIHVALNDFNFWIADYSLEINKNKTKVMYFGNSHK